MTRFRWGVATDIGRLRSVNQDSAYAAEGFFAVADGMGGHQGGEIASAVAIETLAAALPVVATDDVLAAIHAANQAVLDRAREDPSLRGMGTTLCVLALVAPDAPDRDDRVDGNGVEAEPLLVLANVGDSRAYQFAGGVLEQMTDDHSMVGELVRQGRLSAAEAETHPQRNILTRALGIDHRTEIDAWHVRPVPGDRWLLCSDGLFNEVSERTIADVLAAVADPAVAARHLVQLANEHGGRDNITVVVADVLADDGHATPAGALQEGELASARRRVADEPSTGVEMPTAPTGGAGRSDSSGDAHDASDRAAEAVRAPGTPTTVPAAAGAAAEHRAGLVRRARAGWRVVAFGAAFLAVVLVAVGAWIALRDDASVDGPPAPATSTVVPSSTSSTSSTTSSTNPSSTTSTSTTVAVTTTVPPASPGSTTG
jgi:serine/threonine protein phosphatase PrpC